MPPDPPDPPDLESTGTSASTSTSSIHRIDLVAANPPLLRAYLDANAPFLLTNVAAHWKATRDWVAPGEADDFVTIDLLEAAFRGRGFEKGGVEEVLVPVVECRGGDGDEDEGQRAGGGSSSAYGEEPRRERTLTEYATLWRNGEAEARGLYLKDWHIVKALRGLGDAGRHCAATESKAGQNGCISSSATTTAGGRGRSEHNGKGMRPSTATTSIGSSTAPFTSSESLGSSPYYTVPSPLDDDWLNAWWDAPATDAGHAVREDDYCFLYLGPACTTTGVHHDVLCSYSWSVNLAGIKEWTLFPPASFSFLPSTAGSADSPTAEAGSAHDQAGQANQAQSLDTRPASTASGSRIADDPSPSTPPATAPPLVVRQGPGELMFVPSGWHHKVRNLTGCLSINHNWFNRSSLARVWAFLKEEANAVQEKLEHLRDTFDEEVSGWERQCEVVLRANSAMNLTEWVGLLLWKAREVRRVGQAVDKSEARQDLAAILSVLRELASSPEFVRFLFPPHLHEEQEQAAEEESPCLPLRVDLLPRLEAWLAAEIRDIEASLELISV